MSHRKLTLFTLAAVLVACAGQDEELVIPTAPDCPETSTCGAVDGSAGSDGGGGSSGDASLGCSKESVTAADFSVQNTSGALDLDVYWVDFACAEQLFGTVAAQATLPGQSYVTHVWRVRNKANDLLFREFVIQPGANVVSVP